MVKDYVPAGYPPDEPMVPHGQAVSLTVPEASRFSFESAPQRHLRAAELMDPRKDKLNDAAEQLPQVLIDLMRDPGIPNGIGGVGYTESDVPDLAPGTMCQQRLLATCPREVREEDIAGILTRSGRWPDPGPAAGAARRGGRRGAHRPARSGSTCGRSPGECRSGRPPSKSRG